MLEYSAYKNPELKDLNLTSENTISASYRGKPVEIKRQVLIDGNKQYEISFDDNSKINYIIFSNSGKMKINDEEFEMPAGTIVETKSANNREFSKLIQIPNLQKNFINIPEYLEEAEKMFPQTNINTVEQHKIQQPKDFLELTKYDN